MFKKSVLENTKQNPPVEGRQIFDGYASVRTSPRSPPPQLKQRLISGDDVILIWSQHANSKLFRDIFERTGIKVSSKAFKEQKIFPDINEMTTQEILSFCRSIDVHPAHLIPFDNDNRLSLPTPLLELLIEMAYNGNASHGLDSNDVYLARAAIALECKRIQKHKEEQRSLAVENNDGLSRLSQAFIDVLNDPKARKDISKTTIVSPSSCFAAEASRSYPYIDRVHDITVIQEEAELEKSIHSKKLKEQVYLYRVNRLVDIYQKLFHQSSRSPIEAQDFLMDIVDEIEMQQAADLRAPSIDEIAKMFAKLMGQQGKLRKGYDAANDIYIEKFGLRSGGNSEADEAFLREFEFEFYHDLFVGIQGFFEARSNLFRHRIRHEELEGVYILKVGRIRDAFDKVCKPYERNLLNNRVLLSLHNIDLKKEPAPLVTPK